MRVSKWGNSLAIRLPAAVVEALDLKEGDNIEIEVSGARHFEIMKDSCDQAAADEQKRKESV